MAYQLTIVQREPNPEYQSQLAAYEDKRRYGGYSDGSSYPSMEREVRRLDVTLTDEEYARVKRAVLEVI